MSHGPSRTSAPTERKGILYLQKEKVIAPVSRLWRNYRVTQITGTEPSLSSGRNYSIRPGLFLKTSSF
jgi:hypothetical protein